MKKSEIGSTYYGAEIREWVCQTVKYKSPTAKKIDFIVSEITAWMDFHDGSLISYTYEVSSEWTKTGQPVVFHMASLPSLAWHRARLFGTR